MKPNAFLRIVFCIFATVILSGCGYTSRSEIRGRVIDAETEKPVEGAVFAIHWTQTYTRGCCLIIPFVIGYGFEYETVEVADGFTNSDGSFTIPEYRQPLMPSFISYEFGVYKKGYAVWNSRQVDRWDIYDDVRTGKRKPEEMTLPRHFELKDGMIIKLEPWKEGYSAEGHSHYLESFGYSLESGFFSDTLIQERRRKK